MSIDAKIAQAAVGPGDMEETHSVKLGAVTTPDGDIAAQYAGQLSGDNAYTRKEEVRLRWKLDVSQRYISPMTETLITNPSFDLCLCYGSTSPSVLWTK